MRRLALLALALALIGAPAAAQTLPPGGYDCWIGDFRLGVIHVKGPKYREPTLGTPSGPALPYRMDGPAITWGGPLGGITAAGAVVSTVAKGDADGTLSGFDIVLENAQSGNFQSITCYGP